MNKRVFTSMMTLLLAVVVTTASALPAGDAWDGTTKTEVTPTGDTCTITTGAELAWVAQVVNEGTNTFSGKTIQLATNIDLDDKPWTPIGNGTNPFTGTFNGDGHVISNLNVNLTDGTTTLYAGLFGIIGAGGTVKNLGIEGGSVSATSDAYEYAGGIAGENRGTISNCYTNLPVGKTGGGNEYAGGIAGRNHGNGLIENCYALGNVVASEYAGGIAGCNYNNDGTIQYCYATGSVTGKYAGGITCDMGTVKNCIALNAGITTNSSDGGTYRVSNATTKSGNHATACLISGNQGDEEVAGENLTALNFTNEIDTNGAFAKWSAWNLSSPNLPTLKGFKAAQPAASVTRASVMPLTTIANADDLLTFHNITGNHYIYEGEIVTLTASFDFDPQQWSGISNNEAFKGTFDGGGNAINWKGDYISLFEKIDNGGTVKNLAVTSTDPVSFDESIGGIAYTNNGTIENCYTTLSLNAKTKNDDAGGIAANNNGTIRNCYTTGAITAGRNAGGIAANNAGGTIEKCYATGAIKGAMAGGMAGSGTGTIKNCIALNSSIAGTGATTEIGRIMGSPTESPTLAANYAALSIAGTWTDKATGAKNGDDLTAATFTGTGADTGAFANWPATDWAFGNNDNLPTLKDFNTDQPVKSVERAPFLKVPVITIKNQTELAAIANNLSGSYELGDDIILEGEWTPIGNYNNNFTGTLDGCGFVISKLNVSMTGSTNTYAGLFGYISATATVKNLGVTGNVTVNTTTTVNAGGIAGQSEGTITNCYTNVAIDATGSSARAGGIVGYMNNATTSNCFATGNCTTTATATATAYAGGIVGYKSDGSLSYCYATGTVEAKGDATKKYTGGIAGNNTNTLTGCIALNTGGITGDAARTNRVVGAGSSNIAACYASLVIPGTWSNIGATAQNGADLTKDNFTSNDGAFYDWGASWDFTTPANLPKLKTTTGSVINGQTTDRPRTDFLVIPITISTPVNYAEAIHKNKPIELTSTGVLTVDAANATIASLDIAQGGQVITTTALSVTKAMTTSRTLANKWITFGTPVAMAAAPTASTHALTGYATAKAQTWAKAVTIPATLPANTPHLLAADAAGTALTLTAAGTADAPVTIPVFKAADANEQPNSGIFLFRMNPSLRNQTLTNIYALSGDGAYFKLQTADYVVKPFECYLIADAATRATVQSLRVGGDLPTGNEPIALPSDAFRLWGSNGQLHLDATAPAEVAIYTLSGQLLHRFRLDGSRTLTLGRGIYLIHSNNITYKVAL